MGIINENKHMTNATIVETSESLSSTKDICLPNERELQESDDLPETLIGPQTDAKLEADYRTNFNSLVIGDFVLYHASESKQNYVGYGKVLRKVDEEQFTIEIRVYNPGDAVLAWKHFCSPFSKNIYLAWKPGKTEILSIHNIHITEITPVISKNSKQAKPAMLIPQEQMIWMAQIRRDFRAAHPYNMKKYPEIKIPLHNRIDPWPYHWSDDKIPSDKIPSSGKTKKKKKRIETNRDEEIPIASSEMNSENNLVGSPPFTENANQENKCPMREVKVRIYN